MATFGSNRRNKQTGVIVPYGIFLVLVVNCQFVATSWSFWTAPPPAWNQTNSSVIRTVDMPVLLGSTQVPLRWNYTLPSGTVLRLTTFFIDDGASDDIGNIFNGSPSVNNRKDYPARFAISTSEVATLIINKVTDREEATYQCQLAVQGNSWAYNIRVTVTVAAKLTNVSGDQTVLEGSNMQLFCGATGKPTPNITWTRVLGDDSNSEVLHQGPTWNFPNINRTASGTYHCTAYNGFGIPVSQEVRVNVTYPPSITSDGHTIDVPEGRAASIPCPVDGNPQLNITWYKGNDTSTEVIDRGTLDFPDTTLNHSGWYTCFAENNLGNITVSINLLVAKPPTTTTSSTPTTEKSKNTDIIIILGAVFGSVALLVFVAVVIACCLYKKRKCKRQDTKVHNNDPQGALENDQEEVYTQDNNAYADVGPRSNPNNRAVNPSSVPPVTSAKKKKKGVVKEKPVVEYAVVDKSKQKKKEKKPKPGELQYAELGEFSKGKRIPNTSTSPATETQYADINQMI